MNNTVKKIGMGLIKIACAVGGGIFAGFAGHKIVEANTRKKAMDAAIRKNNEGIEE